MGLVNVLMRYKYILLKEYGIFMGSYFLRICFFVQILESVWEVFFNAFRVMKNVLSDHGENELGKLLKKIMLI